MTAAVTDWLLAATGSRTREFYARIGVELPARDSDELPVRCFANPSAHTREDRNPSCSVNVLTGLFCCQACGAKGNATQAAIIRGWVERDAINLAKDHGLFLEVEKPKLPNEPQLRKWREALRGSKMLTDRLMAVKGWSPGAIHRTGLGWDGERIVFTIRDQKLKRVGIVRYLPGGNPKSLAMAGSKRLLFPAPEVVSRRRPVFMVEGEPDAVSVWSCGHQAIAVPGTVSWRREWAQRLYGRQVIVLADCDPQGRDLAHRVGEDVPNAKVVDLEPGRSDGYDVTDMLLEAIETCGVGHAHRQMHDLLGSLA